MLSDGRLVWISNAQRDAAARECTSTSYGLNTLMHLFDAAPSNPAEAVLDALMKNWPIPFHAQARAITTALGVPSPSAEQD